MPKPVENLLPRVSHSKFALTLKGEMAMNYVVALGVLAANPGLTNRGVSEAVSRPPGSMGAPCRAARGTLSFRDGSGSNSVIVGDIDKYVEVCTLLGVTPQVGTKFAKTHSEGVIALKVEHDPLAELRRLVRELRGHMKHDGIVSMEITRDDVKVTRSVTTTSALRV